MYFKWLIYWIRLGFLRTKIKKFWTLQIKDQDQKITFTKWSKIVNSTDQEIKDHFRSQGLMRSKIKDRKITFREDHGSTKVHRSNIKDHEDQKFTFGKNQSSTQFKIHCNIKTSLFRNTSLLVEKRTQTSLMGDIFLKSDFESVMPHF